MKKTHSILACCALIVATSLQSCCDLRGQTEDVTPTGNANLYIKGRWADQAYLLYSKHPFRPNDSITLTEVLFFVSDVTLTNGDKTGTLTDIDLVSFAKNHQTLTGAQKGELIKGKNTIPAATYTTLRFGLGVAPKLNATRPSLYSSTHPLGDASLYWAAQRYVFSRIGGYTYPNGSLVGTPWYYHTGTDAMYKTVTVAIPSTTITADKTTDITINLDLKKLFINGSDTISVLNTYDNPDNSTQRPALDAWSTRLFTAFK